MRGRKEGMKIDPESGLSIALQLGSHNLLPVSRAVGIDKAPDGTQAMLFNALRQLEGARMGLTY